MTTVTRDRAGRRLIVERDVRGSATLVWACWTEPVRLRQWWGPHGWRTDVLELDLRVGGRWRYRLRPDAGHELADEHWGVATYETIDAPHLLRFIDGSSGPDGFLVEGSEMPTEVRITPGTPLNPDIMGRTAVTITVGFPTAEDLAKAEALGMVEGFADALDRLDRLTTDAGSTQEGSQR